MNDLRLHDELAALAASMPDDPGRVGAVQRRARRLRRRSAGARGLAATATIGLAAAGLATAGRGSGGASPAASPPSTTMPECDTGPTVDAKANAALLEKGIGTVAALPSPDAVTVRYDHGDGVAQETTVSILATTEFLDAGQPSARPPLHVGDPIAFVADAVFGGWEARMIDVRPGTTPDAGAVEPEKPVMDDATFDKGIGTVSALPSHDTVTVHLEDPRGVRDTTVSIVPTTVFSDGAQPSARPTLGVGDEVGFAARATADGGWALEELVTHPNVDAPVACAGPGPRVTAQ